MDLTSNSVPSPDPDDNGVVRFMPRLLLANFPESFSERLGRKISHERGKCWLWAGQINPHTGYGRFRTGLRHPRYLTAHRAMWLAEHGELPANHEVRHSCECRFCVNPDHLYLRRVVVQGGEDPGTAERPAA